ncbi:MAG: hypothetical protein LBU19_01095 [Treponema sp.]|nr:hypothetical protein [Treponema sp.]
MEKQASGDAILASTYPPAMSQDGSRGGGRKAAPEKKESPEKMIRSLQGIFCKGRYRSWAGRRNAGV